MAEEHRYDHDSVQEMLAWAKEALKNKSSPSGRYQVNKSTAILDCGKYLESMISMISRNWENPTFYPTIDQLWEFKAKLEQQ